MNWIIASLLMFVSSVALYLFVRRSNALKTPQQLNNLTHLKNVYASVTLWFLAKTFDAPMENVVK